MAIEKLAKIVINFDGKLSRTLKPTSIFHFNKTEHFIV